MGYTNFDAAIYFTVNDVEKFAQIADPNREMAFILKHIQLSKVYLETFRGDHWIDREKLLYVKEYFTQKNIRTSGGLTSAKAGRGEFKTFCYTREEDRDLLRRVVEFTAEFFDEIILDDFFFTNCKCESCIRAKGERSWAQFRIDLLKQVAEEIVLATAQRVNPDVKVIIKYPNWHDDYQNTGYNLEDESRLCDRIYTGTETRDPDYTQQNLQRYHSYFIMRYLENVKPGQNGGGWFDSFDCQYNLNSYIEQCNLTLFAKAEEITLFCAGLIFSRDRIVVPVAGYVMETVDGFLGKLGKPIGIACYKPYHSPGGSESYLHGFLGMLGLPLAPTPHYPNDHQLILLTESAGHDPRIVERIEQSLRGGKKIVITSGLLEKLTGKGIEQIAAIRVGNRKVRVEKFGYPMYECSYGNYYEAPETLLIPQVEYSTNDCVPLIAALAEKKSYPLLLQVRYGQGVLYVLTIPDHLGDLYHLPGPVLNEIRRVFSGELQVRLEGPANLGLFVYDNRTLIVESFLPYNTDVQIAVHGIGLELVDLVNENIISGKDDQGETLFGLKLSPGTYRVLRYQKKE